MIAICEHIHDNGSTCGSPALTGYSFCYFHQRLRHPRHRPGDFEYKLPVLDTPHAILMATQHITQAALDGILEASRARLVLSALRLATTALKEMNKEKVGEGRNVAGENQKDLGRKVNDVGTGAPARVTRAQPAVPAETTDKAASPATAAPALSSRAPLLGEGTASSPEQRNSVDDHGNAGLSCPDHHDSPNHRGRAGLQPRVPASEELGALAPVAKKPPLSTTQLKLMKKILRRGPSDPRFATAARLLDHHIADTA